MQDSSDLGKLMWRNEGTNHTFCDNGIYKLYVWSKEFLTMAAPWTHDYANSKLLGTITMHTPILWPHWGSRPGWRLRRRSTCAVTAMGRLLCAGRAHCGGVAVGGAAAEDALAESEVQLATRVVRLGGMTVLTVRTGCQLLLTLASRQLRRSPRSLAPSCSPRCRRPTGDPGATLD